MSPITLVRDELRSELTDRQRKILEYISQSISERGYPPTLREIGEHFGIRSTNGVNDHLRALEKKGYLQREDLKSRALRPVASASWGAPPPVTSASVQTRAEMPLGSGLAPVFTSDDMVDVPVLGRVAAGMPLLAVENVEDTVKVDRFFVGQTRELFALRVKGDSMIEDGIFDGDFVFVRKQITANRGDIVVAMIGDEATVKRYYPEGEVIRFQPANARMSPILVRKRDFRSVNLLGVVVGVYRKFS